MTATITPVKSSIADKAMLVNLQIKPWGATKEDQDLSRSRRSAVIAGPTRAIGAAGQGD